MPKGKYKGISLPKEVLEQIREVIEKYPHLGYKSLADFIVDAIRKRLEELGVLPPIISLVNFNVSLEGKIHILLWDNQRKRTIDVLLTEKEIRCLYCDSIKCEHVKFAVGLPEVKKEIERRKKLGLKHPDLSYLMIEHKR